MLGIGNQLVQSSVLTMKPLAEERLNLLAALLSICVGAVAMLAVAAIQRAVPLIRDWIQSQRARANQQWRLRPKRLYAPLDEQGDR